MQDRNRARRRPMIRRMYERLTGTPWTTSRSMAAEFGPPPATRYADQLAAYTDAELVARAPAILAELRDQEAAVDRLLDNARKVTR